jgi:hypothetical protein
VLYRGAITDPNDTLVVMIDRLLPIGLKGLFAAGLLAAVMSTVEAALNSTATVTAEDICKHIWPNLRDSSLVLIGRVTAVIVIVFAMIWSPYCGRFANIFVVINKVPMMFAPAITTVFVLGAFWPRGTKQAAVATFAAGLLVGLPYFLTDLPHDVPASKVYKAIAEHRVPKERVVEKWIAGPADEMRSDPAVGVLAPDRIVGTWEALPAGVKNAAREATGAAKDESVEGWLAVPARYIEQAGNPPRPLPGKTVEVWASAPKAELEAALAAGTLMEGWMVINYENITHGKGIPFMMMGLILISMCAAVYVVVSLLTPAPTPQELEQMGWRSPLKAIVEKPISGITDTRIVAVGLFILMIVLYYLLR